MSSLNNEKWFEYSLDIMFCFCIECIGGAKFQIFAPKSKKIRKQCKLSLEQAFVFENP
jgi:hypothetical protein